MTDQWWNTARQEPGAIPFRNKFDAARDPLTARNAIGAVDAKYVADAIAAAGGGGGGAPLGAQYVTAASDATLTAERVLTNTATVTWDFSTAGQAKANAAAGGGGNVSNSGTPTSGQYAKWVTATTIQGVSAATVLSDIGAQPAGSYQPLDADLTAIAALSGTNTIYYRSAANTWSAVNVSTGLAFSDGNLTATAAGGGTGTDTINCGRLAYVSTTALSFKPYNGDRIKINGVVYAIPSGGITGLANTGVFVNGTGSSNLAASTVYWVFAFVNSGTVTADFRTAATHAASATAGNVGTEILTGNDTRTLIGLIRTNASSQFVDSAAQRFVVTWFNRRNLALLGAHTGGTTTLSATLIEVASGSRIEFVNWAEEGILTALSGLTTNNTLNGYTVVNLALDSVAGALFPAAVTNHFHMANGQEAMGGQVGLSASEGYHFLTPCIFVQTGTSGTAYLWASAVIRG